MDQDRRDGHDGEYNCGKIDVQSRKKIKRGKGE